MSALISFFAEPASNGTRNSSVKLDDASVSADQKSAFLKALSEREGGSSEERTEIALTGDQSLSTLADTNAKSNELVYTPVPASFADTDKKDPTFAAALITQPSNTPLTPPQPGSALSPSHVPLPADPPFPQSAAAVLNSDTSAQDTDFQKVSFGPVAVETSDPASNRTAPRQTLAEPDLIAENASKSVTSQPDSPSDVANRISVSGAPIDMGASSQSASESGRVAKYAGVQTQVMSELVARTTKIEKPITPASAETIAPAVSVPNTIVENKNSLTPSQPGSALRPSNVQIPATMPFPQSAAAVLTEGSTPTQISVDAPTGQPLTVDVPSSDLPVALPQPGVAFRPSHMQIPDDSPFPQSAAAAQTPTPMIGETPAPIDADIAGTFEVKADIEIKQPAPSASLTNPTVEGVHPIQLSDAAISSELASTASDSSLAPSQPGPALRPSNVHIPAVSPAPQSAAAVLTAQVSDIPNILTEALGTEDGTKQIKIQLDPPELGRVSIDFKFEGNVLQNVVVTGETPEAMRRLRLMHFELVQTLEDFGYSGQDLDFSQRDQQKGEFFEQDTLYTNGHVIQGTVASFVDAAVPPRVVTTTGSQGLDLKL